MNRQTCLVVFRVLVFLLWEDQWITNKSKRFTKPAKI